MATANLYDDVKWTGSKDRMVEPFGEKHCEKALLGV